MRDLNDDYKLSFRSLAEVYESFVGVVTRVGKNRAIRFGVARPKRPTRAAVLNAILLWLDTRPADEQERIVAEGMARLNALLAGGEDAPPARFEDVTGEVRSDGDDAPPRQGPKRRRGSA